MASAAAVAVDAARSPLGIEQSEAHGIVSNITANDDEHTGLTDDEDEDIPTRPRKAQRPAAGLDDAGQAEDNEEEDLFGDDEPQARRHLDDEALDSGDDEGREDRMHSAEAEEQPEMVAHELAIQDVQIPRFAGPQPTDDEMYLLKVPKFMGFDAHHFSANDFQPPKADHHKSVPSENFSAYQTAMTTVRWRHSPSNPAELQSNARINRWSDGSLTLQFASNPTVQYEINGNALAPPQRNPLIPTPTSIHTNGDKGGRKGVDDAETFDPAQHAFTYLVAPMPHLGLVKVVNVLTTGLTVSPPADFIDEAIANLQSDLAAAVAGKGNGTAVQYTGATTEDPELARQRAEAAEKEKAKARRKQEAQMERERERSNRAFGRSGLGPRHGGGLSAGLLEDDDGLATTRGRTAAKPKAPRRRRANSEYSSEEDYGRRAFQVSKEDDYDKEDDFVAASDEEEEVVDDDEDEDDGIIEEGRAAARREGTPKRSRPTHDEDEDADGEVDDVPVAGERKKKRLVVDDDDEDE